MSHKSGWLITHQRALISREKHLPGCKPMTSQTCSSPTPETETQRQVCFNRILQQNPVTGQAALLLPTLEDFWQPEDCARAAGRLPPSNHGARAAEEARGLRFLTVMCCLHKSGHPREMNPDSCPGTATHFTPSIHP